MTPTYIRDLSGKIANENVVMARSIAIPLTTCQCPIDFEGAPIHIHAIEQCQGLHGIIVSEIVNEAVAQGLLRLLVANDFQSFYATNSVKYFPQQRLIDPLSQIANISCT